VEEGELSQDGERKHRDFVQSLDRGFAVIRAFNELNVKLTLSEVAQRTGLTRATARRFLLTLESMHYVGSTGRDFFLRPKVLELGYAYLSSVSLVSVAQNHLEVLTNKLRESCSASVLEDEEIIYICRAAANRIMSVNLSVGVRLPAYSSSMGKVLLASLTKKELDEYLAKSSRPKLTSHTVVGAKELIVVLDKVREQGWAINDEELEEGVRSVAVPVRDQAGKVIAAINVSAHASRVTVDLLLNDFLPQLKQTAFNIETDLSVNVPKN
jgi:IclR family pca regulon transcriptional regulator